MSRKLLFICKRREDYNQAIHTKEGMTTGLYNSVTFVTSALSKQNIESKLAVVIDNNDIDREVSQYKPTDVIIEALWVVPEKFSVLCQLHPNVDWIIRLHSEVPFLALEGMAWDWIGDYIKFQKVKIACNSPKMLYDTRAYVKALTGWNDKQVTEKVIYLPNTYPDNFKKKQLDYNSDTINIGCFGAVRPLKNHMVQAVASVDFANRIDKKLRFHINSRAELLGDPVIRNLKCMFQHLSSQGHELVFHSWTPHAEFLETCSTMDIGLQISFSETFNIVGADLISVGVPLLTSSDIPWAHKSSNVDPTNVEEISHKLTRLYYNPYDNVDHNQHSLKKYCQNSIKEWVEYFNPTESFFAKYLKWRS